MLSFKFGTTSWINDMSLIQRSFPPCVGLTILLQRRSFDPRGACDVDAGSTASFVNPHCVPLISGWPLRQVPPVSSGLRAIHNQTVRFSGTPETAARQREEVIYSLQVRLPLLKPLEINDVGTKRQSVGLP